MDDIWSKLSAAKINADPEQSRSNTDKKYTQDLNEGQTGGNLTDFYRAVQAV